MQFYYSQLSFLNRNNFLGGQCKTLKLFEEDSLCRKFNSLRSLLHCLRYGEAYYAQVARHWNLSFLPTCNTPSFKLDAYQAKPLLLSEFRESQSAIRGASVFDSFQLPLQVLFQANVAFDPTVFPSLALIVAQLRLSDLGQLRL